MDGGSQKRVDADMGNTTVYRASTAGIKRRELNPYTQRGACMFHRVREIKPIREYELQVTFIDGTIKIYDVTPLFDEIEAFNTLKAVPGLFEQVKVDAGVREYWIVNPINHTVLVYHLEESKFEVSSYTFQDKIKVNIYDELWINFQEITL